MANMDLNNNKQKVSRLIDKGVTIPNPASVDIGEEVDLDRISGEGVVLYSGCKIFGSKTLIMAGSKLGYEAPVSVRDCQIGPKVELKGGFFRDSAFLEKANMGSGAQVRQACIFEEEANGAHTVGLKHTILFPFVTLGSLINFCDCLMAGGTSRKNHSEVGSSYIHFNYTPNQDKATASLIGDVPRGVMLDQNPVFLGGQGGVVGPARLGFGTIIAAGCVFRGDSPEDNRLIVAQALEGKNSDFHPGVYWNIKRRVVNNIHYYANLIALKEWYKTVRSQFLPKSPLGEELYKGVLEKLDLAFEERIKRFKALVQKLPRSAEMYQAIMKQKASQELLNQKKELYKNWSQIEEMLHGYQDRAIDCPEKNTFMEQMAKESEEKGHDYIKVIQELDTKWRTIGTKWLDSLVREINTKTLAKIPSFQA